MGKNEKGSQLEPRLSELVTDLHLTKSNQVIMPHTVFTDKSQGNREGKARRGSGKRNKNYLLNGRIGC